MKKPRNAHIFFGNPKFLKARKKTETGHGDSRGDSMLLRYQFSSEKENITNEACTIFEVISKQNKCKFIWLPNKM